MITIDSVAANLKEESKLKEFILVEVLIYLLKKHFPEEPAEAAVYLLYETSKDAFDKMEEVEEIYLLRRKYEQYKSPYQWDILLKNYMLEDEIVRLFEIKEGKILKVKSEDVIEGRFNNYKESLRTSYYESPQELKYFRCGDFGYYIKKRYLKSEYEDEQNELHRGNIPKNIVLINKIMLPDYKEKKLLCLEADFNWKEWFNEIGWEARNPINLIKGATGKKEKLEYENINHIVGGLGAGKSNYKKAETIRLCKKFNAKIGLVETNVNAILPLAQELSEKGLKVAIILGKANLTKHREAFIRGILRNNDDITILGESENNILSALSGSCEIAALSKHYDIETRDYPCEKLIQGKDKKLICPLHTICGFWSEARKLIDADVWIGTPYSLVYSRIPRFFDKNNRTYYEAMHDLLDIVFMDECDEEQQINDSIFIPTEKIFSRDDYIINKLENLSSLLTKKGMDLRETRYHTFINNLNQFEGAISKIRLFLAKHRRIESFASRRAIAPSYLMMSIINSVKDNGEKSNNFKNLIKTYYENSTEVNTTKFQKHILFQLYNNIRDYGSELNPLDLSNDFSEKLIDDYDIKLQEKCDKLLFIEKLQLYIYLVQVDYYLNHLTMDYPFINENLGEQYETVSVLSSLHKSILSMVSEPMIGKYMGYKFNKDKKSSFITIELVAYVGIGRSLIYKLPKLKKGLGQKGPAVVLLSGTSIAPESGHYNMYVSPEWLLKSNKKEGNIYQEYYPIYDNKNNGIPIKVSGKRDREVRERNLKNIISSLVEKFEEELRYWKENNEYRKILVAVNSYKDCIAVGDTLQNSCFSNRYRIISDEETANVFDKEMLEHFAETNADILVAPLSIIERGYNILQDNKSYFGSIFFPIRPYPVPGDFNSALSIIHSNYGEKLEDIRKLGLNEGMKSMHKFSYAKLNEIQSKIAVFDRLNIDEKIILAWYTLIPVKQTIGRLQRGGTDCRVFYVCGSFGEKEENMLTLWKYVIEKNMDNIYVRELYENFYNGLKICIENM